MEYKMWKYKLCSDRFIMGIFFLNFLEVYIRQGECYQYIVNL